MNHIHNVIFQTGISPFCPVRLNFGRKHSTRNCLVLCRFLNLHISRFCYARYSRQSNSWKKFWFFFHEIFNSNGPDFLINKVQALFKNKEITVTIWNSFYLVLWNWWRGYPTFHFLQKVIHSTWRDRNSNLTWNRMFILYFWFCNIRVSSTHNVSLSICLCLPSQRMCITKTEFDLSKALNELMGC